MATILILGAGVMGTAISIPLSDNKHEVHLVGTHLDGDIIKRINQTGKHPNLQSPIPTNIKAFPIEELHKAAEGADLVILGVNSLGIKWAAHSLLEVLHPQLPVILLTKGLAGRDERIHILPEIFRSELPRAWRDKISIMAIGGPSIAGELAARHQTSAVLTGYDREQLPSFVKLMRTSYFHPSISSDFVGVEVSVGLKNLYALGLGIVCGWPQRAGNEFIEPLHNLSAAMFTQSLFEMAYLAEELGGSRDTVFSIAGIGDLYVTCQGGRNFRMGRLIGSGISYHEAKSQYFPQDSIEGGELAFAIDETIRKFTMDGFLSPQRIPLLLILLDVVVRGSGFMPDIGSFFFGG